jgi:hypothetical protein
MPHMVNPFFVGNSFEKLQTYLKQGVLEKRIHKNAINSRCIEVIYGKKVKYQSR